MNDKALTVEASRRGTGGEFKKGCFTAAFVFFVHIALMCPARIHAQNPTTNPAPVDPRDEIIKKLQDRLDRVEMELKELKAGQRKVEPPPATPPPAHKPAETNFALPDWSDAEQGIKPRFPTLKFHGFGDFSYVASDREGDHNSFGMGHLDFFLNSGLSENMDVLSELVAETGRDNDVKFEVERLLLRYEIDDTVTLAAGRYHSAIGFYNTEYHHGTLFQTAAGRPFIYAFEDDGGILPVHNVGITANGRIPSGSLGLNYSVEVGNGRTYSTTGAEPVLNLADDNGYKSINVGLSASPEGLLGGKFGLSAYYDRVTPEGLPTVSQTIIAAYAVYQRPKVEWLNELLWLRHDPAGADPATYTWSAYSQVGRQLGDFRPYLRYQYLYAPRNDVIFSNFGQTGTIHGPSVGLRYDINPLATLKLQYDHFWQGRGNGGRTSINQVTSQVGFGF